MKYEKTEIARSIDRLQTPKWKKESFYARLLRMNVIDQDDMDFVIEILSGNAEAYYMDVDTDEIYSETDLRDWYYSMDPEDAEDYEDPEDYIFQNYTENGGCLRKLSS